MESTELSKEDVNFIVTKINKNAENIVSEIYDFVRNRSKTYEQLEKNISHIVAQTKWKDGYIAIWLNQELGQKMKEEKSKMLLP